MMKRQKTRLMIAAWAAVLLSACAGVGVPGFGDAGGCRTVYVFTGGGVQPMSSCGALPRDTLSTQRAMISAQPVEDAPVDPAAALARPVTPASTAAVTTAPFDPPASYASPNAMIENADMNAFMTRVRSDYASSESAGAWGYMVVDALAADDPATAQSVIDALEGKPPQEWMSGVQLRPWVMAFNGRAEEAKEEMAKLRRALPSATLLGHRALLAEGLGDYAGALAVYGEAPDTFDAPDPSEAGSMTYFARARSFTAQRLLALRQAELLRGLDRDAEAVDLLTRLLAASPQDAYVESRLERAKAGDDRWKPRTLKQAMAMALGDVANLVEEREIITAAMSGRGAKAPFNHLLSSIRQSALLIDPDNGDIRIAEAGKLYEQGKFEPALRIAQIGNPRPEHAALLQSTAGLAALQLGSPETLEAMVERSLRIDNSPDAKVQAASSLISANRIERALQLIDQAMRQARMTDAQRVFALLTRAQAYSQNGDFALAVSDARAARAIRDDAPTQQFLASLLVDTPERQEGLTIMRRMLADSPNDTGLMNNLGYSLVDGYASEEELEEGFRMLKQAIRLTPDEPNLLDSIGWAYYQYGDFREANRFIEMALEAYAPFGHWELSDHMGDVKWRLGEPDEARKYWQEALATYPPAENARRIEAKLKDGLTTPAPARRDTPAVPLNPRDEGTSDI
jgi:tetratricopeptide (TPR) repeat protein